MTVPKEPRTEPSECPNCGYSLIDHEPWQCQKRPSDRLLADWDKMLRSVLAEMESYEGNLADVYPKDFTMLTHLAWRAVRNERARRERGKRTTLGPVAL